MATIIKKTPQQVNEQTDIESSKSFEQQTITDTSKTNAKVVEKNTPPNLKAQGQDKLAQTINKKRSDLKRTLIPLIIGIATQIGIKNIGTSNIQFPDTCLSQDEINKILNIRNQIVNKLNTATSVIDAFTKAVAGSGLILSIISTLVTTLKTSRTVVSIATKVIPSPPGTPGALVSTLGDLKDLEDTNLEKLNKLNGALASAGLSLSLINDTLLKIINMLNSIDIYLKKCSSSPDLTPLSDTLLTLEKVNNEIQQSDNKESSYNGFILEIIEVPFSPTVNRRKAVAKNSQGIILLETPLSFTTENQILLNSIKLLIDSNNLKAD
jgi:hypothetical protein